MKYWIVTKITEGVEAFRVLKQRGENKEEYPVTDAVFAEGPDAEYASIEEALEAQLKLESDDRKAVCLATDKAARRDDVRKGELLKVGQWRDVTMPTA